MIIGGPFWVFLFGATLAFADSAQSKGCQLLFSKAGACASMTWEREPSATDRGEFTLRFWSRATGGEGGPYLRPASVVGVRLWMPSMGHGSFPVKVSPASDPQGHLIEGIYQASEVHFVKSGRWEIWVELKSEGGIVSDRAKVDYSIQP